MTRWYQEKKREHFYKKAKKEGYRARSAYKLLQIQKKFQIIQSGDVVVDLGAAPGGWSQVAYKLVQPNGLVVGVDLSFIQPFNDVIFLKGDMTKYETIQTILEAIDFEPVSVILSDMSPDISGNYSMDHARSIYLCSRALQTAQQMLGKNGSFVCKVFMGDMLQDFVSEIKESFRQVKQFSPKASRKSSSEQYIIARSYFGKNL
jgi:23S rRNA (uridine2552-2'-O)-methyltransferase